jgi:hypothetical protein
MCSAQGVRPGGLGQYTGEYLVARYADQFPKDIVALARDRLTSHKIVLPENQ